ncbi:C1 family peptidase [Synechocystis sp. FACHB-383]|uniref:C1 family peptidase n=1 Tax=Synechocystis sp. FACHB-383 TaxID=2692864 RepID=UPI00168360CF|nr:C1 family peptidase [Synechocystis sp. FACHB-383]MBD2652708.1 C1 family peptidase [Synechocystis sp. FACHB-383]
MGHDPNPPKLSTFQQGQNKKLKIGAYRPSPQNSDQARYKTQRFTRKELPIRVDLRHYMTAVEAQGEIGSCTANAMAGAYEYLAKRTLGESGDVSRLFIYYNARSLDDETDQDEGTTILNCIQVLQDMGTCPESVWPYDPDLVFEEPHGEAYEAAINFRLKEAERLEVDLYVMKHCLAEGYPFAFGLPLFESFMREGNKGIPMPKTDQEEYLGGHAMLCVGYSEENKVFVVRNSWGEDWGDQGYCYIPYDYLANPEFNDGDCWVVRSVTDLDFSEGVWFEEDEEIEDAWEEEDDDGEEEDWEDLSEEDQVLWGQLGWDEDNWNGETDPPDSSEKSWDELTRKERSAAEKLGYDEESWDES